MCLLTFKDLGEASGAPLLGSKIQSGLRRNP
jgi:hypothetical protein